MSLSTHEREYATMMDSGIPIHLSDGGIVWQSANKPMNLGCQTSRSSAPPSDRPPASLALTCKQVNPR
jgi:hypothetical protein